MVGLAFSIERARRGVVLYSHSFDDCSDKDILQVSSSADMRLF